MSPGGLKTANPGINETSRLNAHVGTKEDDMTTRAKVFSGVILLLASACGLLTLGAAELKEDMRYFPVNRTGIDPDLRVPCPLEPFPQEPVNYGGIDFTLVDPDQNKGAACLVLEPKQNIEIKLGRKADKSLALIGITLEYK